MKAPYPGSPSPRPSRRNAYTAILVIPGSWAFERITSSGGSEALPLEDLPAAGAALSQAYPRFNAVCAPELVDACVYEINAELSRYDYLLRQIKERSGEAVYKTCSEGVAKWG